MIAALQRGAGRSWWLMPLGLVAVSAGAVLAMRWGIAYPCPLQSLFALPCPTCGGTRAFAALARLDLLAAVRFNPLLVLGSFAALAYLAFRNRVALRQDRALPLLFAAIAANWLYLLFFLPR